MDIATVLGLLLGLGLIGTAIAYGSDSGVGAFIHLPSAMITMGGAFAALLVNFPLRSVLGVFSVVKNCFLFRLPTTTEVIQQFNKMAAVARRDGLLALEEEMATIGDSFMIRGLEMVVGGSSKEEVQEVLDTEISYIEERHKTGKKIIDALGASAPAFGMIGTLIGLVQMLRTLEDPSQIGAGMATALLTTLYGAVVANLICIPLAGKLETRSREEILIRSVMVVGMVSLVEGHAPRAIQERLMAFVAPKERAETEASKAA